MAIDTGSQRLGRHDAERVWNVRELYAQAEAARLRSELLAEQLRATQRQASENWQLIQDAWGRTEQIRARGLAARSDPDRLRYSASARLQARLASMPVIEQAKGIIMAQYGWPEDQAFDAMCRVSQQENIKIRDLATSIVAGIARPADGEPAPTPAPPNAQPDAEGGDRARQR